MSSVVGNITSRADYERKVREQQTILRIQRKLNQGVRPIDRSRADVILGVVPQAPLRDVPVAEQLDDQNLLRQDAFQQLIQIMPRADSANFVNKYLNDLDELIEFTSVFDMFYGKMLKGRKRVTPEQLQLLWTDYKRIEVAGTTERGALMNVQADVDRLVAETLDAVAEAGLSPSDAQATQEEINKLRNNSDIAGLRALLESL